MYDLMIIDDDKAIIDHLKSMIEWDRLGLSLVCEAEDSDTALELYLIHHPKIIITDINIPTISGLKLAQKLNEIDPEIRFIIITGYNDFEYVKDSVALGAVELLSKPLLPHEVNGSLQKAIFYFDDLRSKQASAMALQQLLDENTPMLREKYVGYIFKTHSTIDATDIKKRLAALKLDIIGSFYAVILILPDLYRIPSQDIDLLLFSIKNISDEILSKTGFKIFSFTDDSYRLNCLVSWEFENGNEILEEAINKIYEKVNFFFQNKIFAGIGQPVTKITELSVSWNQALTALNYQDVLVTDTIINYKNIERLDAPIVTNKEQMIEELSKHFKMNHIKKISDLLNQYFASLVPDNSETIMKMREFSFKYISTIVAESLSLGINIESISDYSNIFAHIFSCKSILALKQYILELTEKLLEAIFQKRSDSKNQLIEMAKTFVDENLGNKNLNLDMVSNHISLSSIYFCKLFHKEEGISFNEYLNTVRIHQAKKLLAQTSKKVFEISYETGYGNPKHFNYVFKRIEGVTPLEYRKIVNSVKK